MDQDSGFRTVVDGYLSGLLRVGAEHEYVLFYRTDKYLGTFADHPNVSERLIKAPHKLLWDQIAVPYHAWREHVQVLFNPKFSVPLISPCPVTMGLQEPVWYAWPQHYERFNVFYMRLLLPLYVRKASYFFPNSQFILDENRKYLKRPFDNASLAYSATHPQFHPSRDAQALAAFRQKYDLPERYILSLTRVDHPGLDHSNSFHGGKNPETTVRAFMKIRDRIPHQLVMAGRRVPEYMAHLGFNKQDLDRITFIEWIPFEELASLYNAAELFVIPSFYEGNPNTLMQAMACGCPVVASNTGGCPDTGGDAPLFADPYSADDFAEKMLSVLQDRQLQDKLRQRSLKRSEFFSWDRTAKMILDALQQVAKPRPKAGTSRAQQT